MRNAALQARHRLIGDVRGLGPVLGVELVRDRATLEPAGGEVSQVIDEMRTRGCLFSTDGRFHNVFKIEPPLVLEAHAANAMLAALDEVPADFD